MKELKHINIELIKRGTTQLRVVLKNTLEYTQMRDSIRDLGILTPLLVRPQETMYEVVEGANRYEICLDLGIPSVPCYVRDLSDTDVLRAQVAANSARIETKPAEYARRLWKIVNIDHSMTRDELATFLRWHPDQVDRTLSLVNLSKKATRYLTNGDLYVTIAIEVSKLPIKNQDSLLEAISRMSYSDGLELARQEVRCFREGKRSKRGSITKHRIRSLKEVEDEYVNPVVAASVLSSVDSTTKLDSWQAALGWAIHADPTSLEEEAQRHIRLKAKEAEDIKRRITQHNLGEQT